MICQTLCGFQMKKSLNMYKTNIMRVTFVGVLTSQRVDFNIYLFVPTLPHPYLQFNLGAKLVKLEF